MDYSIGETENFLDFLVDSLAAFSDEDLELVNDLDFEFFHEIKQDTLSDVIVSTKSQQTTSFPIPEPSEENSSTNSYDKHEATTDSSDVSFSTESQQSSFSPFPMSFFNYEKDISRDICNTPEVSDDIFKKKADSSANRLRFLARWTEISRRQVIQLEKNIIFGLESTSTYSNLNYDSDSSYAYSDLDYDNIDALDNHMGFIKAVDNDSIHAQKNSQFLFSETEHGFHGNPPHSNPEIDIYIASHKNTEANVKMLDMNNITSYIEPQCSMNKTSILNYDNNDALENHLDSNTKVIDYDGINAQCKSQLFSKTEHISQGAPTHFVSKFDININSNKDITAEVKGDMNDITSLSKLQASMKNTQISRCMFSQAIREEKLRRIALTRYQTNDESSPVGQSMLNQLKYLRAT